ncbi:MAG: septation protein SpoVG family protein [Candidatus Omnitrophota bacterium]
MEITEARVFLKEGQDKKLKAYVTLTFDNQFVVRNVKVIEGSKGLFVAMPSRKMKDSCPKCGYKNVVRSRFCNQCGVNLGDAQRPPHTAGAPPGHSEEERLSEHKDIAHPITLEFREYIQKKVLEAYEAELKKGPRPSPGTIEDPQQG